MKVIPQISLESQLLIDRLAKVAEGEIITYEELSKIAGRDVQHVARSCLMTARKRLFNEQAIYFSPVFGVGLKRCTDADKVDCGAAQSTKVRRAAKKGMKVCLSVQNFDKLNQEQKTRHNVHVSLLGAIAASMTTSKIKALTSKVEAAKDKLPLTKTLEALF